MTRPLSRFLVTGLVPALLSCALAPSAPALARSGGFAVAFLIPNATDPRWGQDARTFIRRLEDRDPAASWVVLNAQNSESIQIAQAKAAVDGGARVLVVAPVNSGQAVPIVAYAHQRGVRVLAYGRPIDAPGLSAFIGFDPVAVGHMLGSFVLTKVSRGNLVIIEGPIDDRIARLENRGLYGDALAAPIIAGRYTKTLQVWEPAWSSASARNSTFVGLIDVHRDVAAFVDESDALAAGTIDALVSSRLHSIVTGAGSSLGGLRQVLKGNQSMTAFEPGSLEATAAADGVIGLLRSSRLPRMFRHTFPTATGSVPAALFTPVLATAKTVTKLVTKGYLVPSPKQGPMNVQALCEGIAGLCSRHGIG